MIEGTLKYADLTIEWSAGYDDDDGFTWSIDRLEHSASGHTLADLARSMLEAHDDIEREVRSAFIQACAERNENMRLSVVGL